MKTESQYTSDVLGHLRTLEPLWVVTKINDRTTAGIPDAFVCNARGTTWIEFKRSNAFTPNVEMLLTPAQKRTLSKMHTLGAAYHVLVRTPATWKVYNVHGFVMDLTPSSKETAAWLCQ